MPSTNTATRAAIAWSDQSAAGSALRSLSIERQRVVWLIGPRSCHKTCSTSL
jgi:hypothetical protein